jgi:hypothetical protein
VCQVESTGAAIEPNSSSILIPASFGAVQCSDIKELAKSSGDQTQFQLHFEAVADISQTQR